MGRETLATERTVVARAMLVTAVRSIFFFNVYKKCGELVKEEKSENKSSWGQIQPSTLMLTS